jgi:hypothetical protein
MQIHPVPGKKEPATVLTDSPKSRPVRRGRHRFLVNGEWIGVKKRPWPRRGVSLSTSEGGVIFGIVMDRCLIAPTPRIVKAAPGHIHDSSAAWRNFRPTFLHLTDRPAVKENNRVDRILSNQAL